MDFLADVATERAVLSGLMQYGNDAFIDIDDVLENDSFTINDNIAIYKCIKHHFKQSTNPLDYPSIFSAAKELNLLPLLDTVDNTKYINGLKSFPVKQENVRKLAIKLRKLHIARLMYDQLEDCQNDIANVNGTESINEILNLAESKIFEFSNTIIDNNTNGAVLLGEGIREYIEHIKNDPKEILGISTGFPLYDMSIGGGLRRGTVNLVGARAKTGKTTFGINVALHVAGKLNIPVLMLDTEMNINDHRNKSLGYYSDVAINDIETGKFTVNRLKLKRVDDAVSYIEQIPYTYQCIAGMDFDEVLSIARRWITKTVGYNTNGTVKDCLIIYDYLKLMTGEGLKDMQEYQMLGFQMTNLHNFTVKYDVPCLTFIQLNRDGITKETADVAAQSDRLVWFCSNFSLFKHKSDEEIAEEGIINGNRKLIPLVCRHGKGLEPGDYINMELNGDIAKITEKQTRYQVHSNKKKDSFEDKQDNGDVAY